MVFEFLDKSVETIKWWVFSFATEVFVFLVLAIGLGGEIVSFSSVYPGLYTGGKVTLILCMIFVVIIKIFVISKALKNLRSLLVSIHFSGDDLLVRYLKRERVIMIGVIAIEGLSILLNCFLIPIVSLFMILFASLGKFVFWWGLEEIQMRISN